MVLRSCLSSTICLLNLLLQHWSKNNQTAQWCQCTLLMVFYSYAPNSCRPVSCHLHWTFIDFDLNNSFLLHCNPWNPLRTQLVVSCSARLAKRLTSRIAKLVLKEPQYRRWCYPSNLEPSFKNAPLCNGSAGLDRKYSVIAAAREWEDFYSFDRNSEWARYSFICTFSA